MAVPVGTGAAFRAGTPKPLFRFPRETQYADITRDGETIVAVVPTQGESRSILNLVMHWQRAAGSPRGWAAPPRLVVRRAPAPDSGA